MHGGWASFCAVVILLATGNATAQPHGGLRVFEAEQESICRDGSSRDTEVTEAMLEEIRSMLIRMDDLQSMMLRGVSQAEGGQIRAEIEQMRARTVQMLRELQKGAPVR